METVFEVALQSEKHPVHDMPQLVRNDMGFKAGVFRYLIRPFREHPSPLPAIGGVIDVRNFIPAHDHLPVDPAFDSVRVLYIDSHQSSG